LEQVFLVLILFLIVKKFENYISKFLQRTKLNFLKGVGGVGEESLGGQGEDNFSMINC
jgi:hypothetical protein